MGVLFMHNEGYSTMCGHGIIGVTVVVLETGLLRMEAPETVVRLDTPAGLVIAYASVADGRVTNVRFRNVPAFALALDQGISVPELGWVGYDIAFGGAFYAYVDAEALSLRCTADHVNALIDSGRAIKKAVASLQPPRHPVQDDLGFLYGTIFVGPALGRGANERNVCVFADGQVDRCPTGTGVSGRLAIEFARSKIGLGETLVFESIIGSHFSGRIVGTTAVGSYTAVVPEVAGTAYITGRHEFLIDPDDPLRQGFILR
jgi:trans-L-3-hydroxyproline dehydratase